MAQSLTDKVSNEEMNEVMNIKKLKLLNLTLLQILDRICKVKLEFDRFLFFETCRSLKLLGQLKIDKSEINNFLDEIKRGTEMGTEN